MAGNETLSVRRIPFYLFLILLGFLIFYVYDQVRKRNHGNSEPVPTQAAPISKKTADTYITNYLRSQDSLGDAYKLVTKDGKTTLRGFWISKETLKGLDESIRKIDKTANIVGYSVYFGKTEPYEKDKSQALTLVVRGTVPGKAGLNNAKIRSLSNGTDEVVEDEGDFYDSTDPCPERCGEPEPQDSSSLRQQR